MTITINSRENLTYEEIYEGYSNGKSRLPKTLKDIEAGVGANDPDSMTAKANASGVEIKRRRTGGGNASNTAGLGLSSQPTIARLLSKARYDALVAGYDGSNPDAVPSQNFVDSDVRGVVKNPFDLIDFVSGIDNADQLKGSGNALSTRAAKLKAIGSNVVTRDFTEFIGEDDANQLDMRARFGDRVGAFGATGEVHGVDQGIQSIMATDAQAQLVGSVDGGAGLDLSTDTTLSVDVDNAGIDAVVYPSATVTVAEAAAETAAQLSSGDASVQGDFVKLKSDGLGAAGELDVSEANTAIGFPTGVVTGATAASASLANDETVIDLSDSGFDQVVVNVRYQTYQFGTLRIFTSINDADPVAYVLHPDLVDDLIANNP